MQNKQQKRTTMFALIEKWKDSDLSKGAFCKAQNFPSHVFYYWCGVYQKASTQAESIFIPLQMVDEQPISVITIEGENGIKLQVPLNNQTVGFIKQLLSA